MRLLTIIAAVLVTAACASSPEGLPRAGEAIGQPQQDQPEAVETAAEQVAEPESSPASAATSTDESDPAQKLAASIGKAHGSEAMSGVGEIVFDFAVVNAGSEVVRISHRWDVNGRRALVSYANKEGAKTVTLVHLDDPTKGWATVDGAPASDAKKAELLKSAYARWVNDAYWLAMPLKLRDAGVVLEQLPDQKVGGKAHHVLKVTFETVGLTPGDTYWVFADKQTHVVSRWDMLLENAPKDAKPTTVSWSDPQSMGGLTLHKTHAVDGTPRQIVTELKSVSAEVDAAAWQKPAP